MKRTVRVLVVVMLVVAMFASYASALTFNVLDNEEIFNQETIEKEKMSSYAKEEILAAREAGLIPVLTDDPAYRGNITREQFAELVVRTVEVITGEEAEAAPADTFTDTSNPEILKAYNMEIINGMGDGVFAPKDTATRQQIATMISRALDYIEEKTETDLAPEEGTIEIFTDKASIQSWATEGVGRLAANEIMKGVEKADGTVAAEPNAFCKVEDSILLLYRVYGNSVAE